MSFNLDSITKGTVFRAPRIVLLGVEKIGKSTFASGSESPIFIPIKGEEGIDDISAGKFPACGSLGDVITCLNTLHTDEHELKSVVIDSASALEPLIHRGVCLRNENADSINKGKLSYGVGHTEALNDWRTIIEWLDVLRRRKNMTSIIIGHVRVRRFDDPGGLSYDQYQFDLHDKAANLLYRWADLILFCNTKVVVKQEDAGFNRTIGKGKDFTEGQRFLYTQKRPSHPGGGRGIFGRLPYELDLTWSAFQEAVIKLCDSN